MNDELKKTQEWLNKLVNFSVPKWEDLPNLDLYMDQVITYLERELSPIMVDDQNKLITTSMINNYVKANLLPNPIQKKYSRKHLALMIAICSVKQILSINDIAIILNANLEDVEQNKKQYSYFGEIQTNMINSVAHEALTILTPYFDESMANENVCENERLKFLNNFAFKLAIEAEVKKILSNQIINLIRSLDKQKKYEDSLKEKTEKELVDKLLKDTEDDIKQKEKNFKKK